MKENHQIQRMIIEWCSLKWWLLLTHWFACWFICLVSSWVIQFFIQYTHQYESVSDSDSQSVSQTGIRSFVCSFTSLSIYPSICLSVCQSVVLSIQLFIINLFICSFVHAVGQSTIQWVVHSLRVSFSWLEHFILCRFHLQTWLIMPDCLLLVGLRNIIVISFFKVISSKCLAWVLTSR